ncbi:MAG: hypothetical protein ABSA92_01310 [Candidatus Bathyarchaeia archaeon]|jgi:hypothetical protein
MSGLGRAWVRSSVRTAKSLLAELDDLTPEDKAYLTRIVTEGEIFLRLTKDG